MKSFAGKFGWIAMLTFARATFLCVVVAMLSGCSGTSTELVTSNSVTGTTSTPSVAAQSEAKEPKPLVVASNSAAPVSDASSSMLPRTGSPATRTATAGNSIIGARNGSVVLYASANGHDGQKLGASALSFPLRIRSVSGNGRFEISTADGPKWVQASEVITE